VRETIEQMKRLNPDRIGLTTGIEGKRIIVQGMGNVGYWVAKFFHDAGARIIAISGGGRMDADTYLKWASRLGVEHTFTKPVGREEMLSAVITLLENSAVSC